MQMKAELALERDRSVSNMLSDVYVGEIKRESPFGYVEIEPRAYSDSSI